MTSDEFWCQAFLAAMQGSYAQEGTWSNHNVPAAYCKEAAHAALAAAQRCGMVTGEASAGPVERHASESVEFTVYRAGEMWHLNSPHLDGGIQVHSEQLTYPIGGGVVAHITWGETMPPKPIEVRLERGGA